MKNEASNQNVDRRPSDTRSRWLESVPPPLPAGYDAPHDGIVHDGAPPISGYQRAIEASKSDPSVAESFNLELRLRDREVKQESAGWLSSVALHALLLIALALLLAPADFGGERLRQLIVTLSNQEAFEDPVIVEVVAVDTESASEVPAPEAIMEPVPVQAPIDNAVAVSESAAPKETSTVKAGGSAGGGESAGGSFFGIDAVGHQFVYILDMSGSMRGARYRRATEELVRSVEGLQQSQSFYVLLFNGSTVQMFGESNLRPTPIAATGNNKQRLSRWLDRAFKGGSTDPRGALKIAMRMDPSAIFMLSDGEFDDPKTQPESSLLGGNMDAFAIVEAAGAGTPIHAIAFEDPRSCQNMKRLAMMTSGEYRFTKARDNAAANAILKRAGELIGVDDARVEELLRQLIEDFGSTEASWKAREQLATILAASAEQAFAGDELDRAKDMLIEIVEIDPRGTVTAKIQASLVKDLVDHLRDRLRISDDNVTLSIMAELVERFPESQATREIVGPVAEGQLRQARKHRDDGDLASALRKLELTIKKYPTTDAAAESKNVAEEMTHEIFATATELEKEGNAVFAKHLRGLALEFEGTRVQQMADERRAELATRLIERQREATVRRDRTEQDTVTRQLAEAFAGDPLLQKVQRDLNAKERKAREMLREATRFERITRADRAQQRYREIMEEFSGTLAAIKARQKLQAMQPEPMEEVEMDDLPFVGDSAVRLETLLQ